VLSVLGIRRSGIPLLLGLLLPLALAGPVSAAQETICGRVDAVGQDSATVDGRTIPLHGLDGDAVAGLQLALNGSIDACVDVEVADGSVTQALGVSVTADLCGHVRPVPGSDVMVDRVAIPPELTDSETYEALRFAMNANAAACLAIDVAPGEDGSVVVVVLAMEACATVTDVDADTITLNGMAFDVAAGAELDAEVGDVICVIISSADGGGVEVTQRTDEDEEGEEPGQGNGGGTAGGGGSVPDTAIALRQPDLEAVGLLLVAAAALLTSRQLRPARVGPR
jgi:hypothetical protein